MNPKTKAMVIYHGNCADGFAAAWVCREHFAGCLDDVEFVAGVYQTPPPDVTGLHVYIVDFSYKRAVILEMLAQCESLTIIDHHASAIDDLKDLTHIKFMSYFDIAHSGSMLTWKYFFGEAPCPDLLLTIEDRDLWRFKLNDTRQIQANLFSYPYDFDIWTDLMRSPVHELARDGIAIERKHFKDIRELLAVGQRRAIIGGYDVPVCNLPYTLSSDAGHDMDTSEVFAACWMETKEGIVFSLRSDPANPDHVDVSEVAKKYGGGGHKHAAGFKIDRVAFEEIPFYNDKLQ